MAVQLVSELPAQVLSCITVEATTNHSLWLRPLYGMIQSAIQLLIEGLLATPFLIVAEAIVLFAFFSLRLKLFLRPL